MKGIVLAGGTGTRLYPITKGTVKQLLPIYDKPLIYYPIFTLLESGIKDILMIVNEKDLCDYKDLLSDGSEIGVNIQYKIQDKPNGIAESFILGEEFIGEDDVCLILGDNIFHGGDMKKRLKKTIKTVSKKRKSVVFGYEVSDPERYGVVEFNKKGKVVSIIEKPSIPKSNYAVSGLYFYTNEVIGISKKIKPSERGELEITDVNNEFMKKGKLSVELLGDGYMWLDTGTYDSLLEAGNYVEVIEKRQGIKVGCIEEIAFKNGFISKKELKNIANKYSKNSYGKYLLNVVKKGK